MDRLSSATQAIATNDHGALIRLLDGDSDLTASTLREERFVDAIVHQLYAGDTLLHVAAAGFRADMVASLLSRGADVTATNRRGAQPLHYAADTNRSAPDVQAETIRVLLKAGADVNAVDKSGVVPLHRAVRSRGSSAVKALLEGGADPNRRNASGSTPLHLALQTTGRGGSGTPEAKAEQAEIVRLLLPNGADADAKAVQLAAKAKLSLT